MPKQSLTPAIGYTKKLSNLVKYITI